MPETVATPSAALPAARAAGLYDSDFYSWTVQQADALQRRDADAIDWDNIIDEIESLGKQQKRTWTSHAAQAIHHLLKIEHYEHATERNLIHWSGEVMEQRDQMAAEVRMSTGIKGSYGEMLQDAWRRGRRVAVHSLAGYDHECPATCAP